MRDEIYKDPDQKVEKFTFSPEVTNVFNDMIVRSVPGYRENLTFSAELIYQHYRDGEWIVDLGASTGALAESLLERFGTRPFYYLGIDSSPSMVETARKRVAGKEGKSHIEFRLGDIRDTLPEKISVAVSAYTLQFIRPEERLALLKRLHNALLPGGAFLFSEKVVEKNEKITSLFRELHHELKRKSGYSELEIARKRDAIENILIPLSDEENRNMVLEAGFEAVSIYLKVLNFASYLAVKT